MKAILEDLEKINPYSSTDISVHGAPEYYGSASIYVIDRGADAPSDRQQLLDGRDLVSLHVNGCINMPPPNALFPHEALHESSWAYALSLIIIDAINGKVQKYKWEYPIKATILEFDGHKYYGSSVSLEYIETGEVFTNIHISDDVMGNPSERWMNQYDCTRQDYSNNAEKPDIPNGGTYNVQELICDNHHEGAWTYELCERIVKIVAEGN